MANTYNQIYVHFIISVKNRMPLIKPEWEQRLYQYITTSIDNRKNKTLIINGTKDHIHIFVSMDNSESPAKLMLCIKQFSSKFIKNNFPEILTIAANPPVEFQETIRQQYPRFQRRMEIPMPKILAFAIMDCRKMRIHHSFYVKN